MTSESRPVGTQPKSFSSCAVAAASHAGVEGVDLCELVPAELEVVEGMVRSNTSLGMDGAVEPAGQELAAWALGVAKLGGGGSFAVSRLRVVDIIRRREAGLPRGRTTVDASRIHERVPAVADQVPRLRHTAAAFAGPHCDEDTQRAIALAVTEACTNVVRHAYPQGRGDLALTAWLDGTHLMFEIADDGTWLDDSPSETLGMGLVLMRRLGEADITSNERGTRVELRFPQRSQPT